MKNTIKSILALALVACGLQTFAGTKDFGNPSKADGYTGGTLNGKTLTVGNGSDLEFVAGGSNDSLNRNTRGWYAGLKITFPEQGKIRHDYAHAKVTYPSTTDYTGNNFAAGSGLTETTTTYFSNPCVNYFVWWTWITPEEAYAANGAKISRKVTVWGNKTSYGVTSYTANAADFYIEFPTATLTLTGGGHTWFPAEILVDDKVYGEVPYALQQTGTIKFIKNTDTTCDFSTDSRTFDLNNKTWAIKGGTITGSGFTLANGKPVVYGGTFDFDPTTYLAPGYEVKQSGGKYVVQQGHKHVWTYALNGNVLTATCSGEGTCPVTGKSTSLTLNFAGKSEYDGIALADATVTDGTQGGLTFKEATGATYDVPTYEGDRKNAGDCTAKLVVTTVEAGAKTLTKKVSIGRKNISGAAITLSPASSFTYDGTTKTVTPSATKDGLTVTFDVSGTTSTREMGTHTVTLTGNGNFMGTATASWTINNVSGTAASAALTKEGMGTFSGTTLNITDTSKLEYDAASGTWYAGITFTFPYSKDDGTLGGWQKVQYTDASKGEVRVGDTYYTGAQAVAGVDTTTYKLTGVESDSHYRPETEKVDFKYLNTVTYRLKVSPAIIQQAIAEQKTAITGSARVGGYIWADPTWGIEKQGDKDGVQFRTFTINIPIDANLKLYDEVGNRVYPDAGYVAQVAETKLKYTTLGAALSAATAGQTVNALAACEQAAFNVGANVTLNLGGFGAAGASYEFIDVTDLNMGAKVVSTKAETVTTDVTGFAVKNENNTYTIYRAHIHAWSFALNGAVLTATCTEQGTDCDLPGRATSIELTVTDNGDGVAPTFAISNADNFLASVNKFNPSLVTIGSIASERLTKDGAEKTRWYVGDYRATCDVTIAGEGTLTLTNDFSIAKPEGGYTSGWEVGSTGIRYLEEDLSIVYKTAADGDTIYYRDTSRDFETHDFSVGNKNLTFDFNGKTLSNDQNKLMTLKNTGSGTLTFQNVVIQQPKDSFVSNQIQTDGKIVFGDGVKAVNQADNKSRYLTITVNSGSLIVSNGLYQCGFATANNATVLLEAGKYWEYDPPALGQYDLADRVCREITEVIGGVTYKYAIVEHVHVFAYTAEGVVITCKCEGMDKEACYWYQNPQTATLTANDADESSEPYAGASVSYDIGFIDQTQPITYWQGDEQLSGAPTRFGTYTAKLTVGGATAAKSFTINPMKVNITVPDAAHGKVTQVLDGETEVAAVEGSTYSVTHGNKITATYAADNGYEPATLTATLDCAEPGDTVTPPTFAAIKYPISYELNGGTNHDDNPPTYTIEDAVELKPATKRGYTFTGWDPAGVIAKGSMGERTFAATWTPTVYKVEYVMSNGTNHADNPATYTVEQSVALKNPTRKGYEFTGWSPTNGIAPGSIDNRTFYATWTATVYTVEFRDAVTEEAKAEAMHYTIETASPLKLRDLPEQPNYTANGWLTNRLDVTGQAKTGELDISADMLGNKTFYVHFVFQTPEDPSKPDAPQVVIPQVVVTNIVEDAETKTAEQINEELNTPSNGVTKVERYVLGLDMKDMNDVPVIQPEQTADATTVRVHVGNIAPLPENVSNAKVRYSIETSSTPDFANPTHGEQQATPTFDLPLPASGVMYYRAKIDLVKPE